MSDFVKKYFFCSMLFLLPLTKTAYAQIVIGSPSLRFSQICANVGFNSFSVDFSFSPVTGLSDTNQFIVEMSDPNGSFTNSTVIFTSSPGSVKVSPATLTFSVPTTIAGEQYKLRIKSTGPVATSSNSVVFSAYYKIQDSPFSINNFNATAMYCSGGSFVLTIDNPGTGSNDSPLKYPRLTYRWYKEGSSLPVATTPSLTINQPGKYYVETNYGSCTSNSYSNRVTVSESSATAAATITSSLGNPFCSDGTSTILTTVAGTSYQWYKNNGVITGATSQTYLTNQPGQYTVVVDFGGCIANASIDLQKYQFNSIINVPKTSTILPNESVKVSVKTTASNPEYQWYFNDAVIPNAIGSDYEVTKEGNYKVVVKQTSGCVVSEELSFQIINDVVPQVVNIPNLISPNGDGINDTWIVPQEYASGSNAEILLINSSGELILKTNNYQNNWPENMTVFKNVYPVYYYIITTQDRKVRKGSITVLK